MKFLEFWTRETLANIRRNRLMSLLAISTVTVALFILGAFYLVISNLRTAVGNEARQLDLVVILDKSITAKRRDQVVKAARIPQVEKVDLKYAAQALQEFKQQYADLPLDDFADDNPLGDELHIRLKNPEDFFKVRSYLATIKGISAVQDNGTDAAARKLLGFKRFLTVAAMTSLIVLGLAILLIIHNAIRLTVFARRREIRIMQLVGATSGFIRVPFLLEGIIYGICGALLATIALTLLYGAATGSSTPLLRSILPLSPSQILVPCAAMMLGAGLLFGIIGAVLSFWHSQRGVRV